MWEPVKEYIKALSKWLWVILIGICASGIGAYLNISGIISVPIWVWLIVLAVALLVAPFKAFNKMRSQRDELRESYNDVANRIIVVANDEYKFERLDEALRLWVYPQIFTMPDVRVEDVKLEMMGKSYDTSWDPANKTFSGEVSKDIIYVDLPKSLKYGKYTCRIVAIIENKEYYSDDFELNHQRENYDKWNIENRLN